MERKTLFVDVILPLALYNAYTYRVPNELNDSVEIGKRVVIQFGKNKVYSALIVNVHSNAPTEYQPKYIEAVLDPEPIINKIQIEFWNWVANYYLCTIGEVMNVALPSALKLESETNLVYNPEHNFDIASLDENEYLLTEALQIQNNLKLKDVEAIIGKKNFYPIIKNLIDKNIAFSNEELIEEYKEKSETYISLNDEYKNETKLNDVFNSLEKKAPKQLNVLITFLKLSNQLNYQNSNEVKKSDLAKASGENSAVIDALIKKEIFIAISKSSQRIENYEGNIKEISTLNEFQQKASEEVEKAFEQKDVVLLHGVTSSGKTEIYINLIDKYIKQNKQVLYLLPEIALTTQIITRLQKNFGDRVAVYHSKFNKNERVEIWNNLLGKKITDKSVTASIIIGPRSALFLPYKNLGLIIVDEEHESSYKQFDPAPRYNARDVSVYLASLHKSKVLLGSATPSVESYYNAAIGKYSLVELNHRYGNVCLPQIKLVNIKEESKNNTMKSHFSSVMIDEIEKALAKKEQVILFQNRRGFSNFLECDFCKWIPSCKNCDVILTYHKKINQLKCHYCGYSISTPSSCGFCKETKIRTKGFGTEKIEDELPFYFPEARIARMDYDTTQRKHSHKEIITKFENQSIDILVGTQMITKGLDFDNVSLVGILNADLLINFPDFRANERAFQLMLQVAGRAGRKNTSGKVIIQTNNPKQKIFEYVINNNYKEFYEKESSDRQTFRYPPYFRLIQLTLKHKKVDVLNSAASIFASKLRNLFKDRILGPEFPLVSRIKNEYIKQIIIKVERDASVVKAKNVLQNQIEQFKTHKEYKSLRISIDVDPM